MRRLIDWTSRERWGSYDQPPSALMTWPKVNVEASLARKSAIAHESAMASHFIRQPRDAAVAICFPAMRPKKVASPTERPLA